MADTIQVVQWSIGSGEQQHLWLPQGRECLNDVLWESIRRKDLESQFQQIITITDPLWYGLWIDSPLSQEQSALLHRLFSDVLVTTPRYADDLDFFMAALTEAAAGRGKLHVDLAPPGHTDFGWITIFVHCPRCKAEGPVDRWQSSYSDEPVDCPICAYTYSPTETYHSEREYFATSATCTDCNKSFLVKDFSETEIAILEDERYYHKAVEELSWLRRVSAFYNRHPAYEGKIDPHFMNVTDSDDPAVKEDLWAGVPFDRIRLADDPNSSEPIDWSVEDRKVADYLRHHHFSLPHRLRGVEEAIEQRESEADMQKVACPECGGTIRAHHESSK